MAAIDPSFLTSGPEWSVGSLKVGDDGGFADPTVTSSPTGGQSFGSMLSRQMDGLAASQDDAAKAAQSLADGTATDPSSVVLAVDRARLSMQLAAQLRTKSVEAVQEIFRTQV